MSTTAQWSENDLAEAVRAACMAADSVAVGFQGTGAERTRATIQRAIEALLGNGIVTPVPRGESPDWIVLDPPYKAS